jgi:hypothetical protein
VFVVAAEQLAVGEPCVVVDRDVQVLPAGVAAALHTVGEDPLTDHPEAAELLGVDVQQLARPLALVADAPVALWSRQPRQAGASQHLADRRGRPLEHGRERHRASPQLQPAGHDLRLGLR